MAGFGNRVGGAPSKGLLNSGLGDLVLNSFRLQLGEINDELDTLSNDPSSQATQTMLRAIQRHRDVHQDNIREFRRTKVCWTTRVEGQETKRPTGKRQTSSGSNESALWG